MRILTPEELKIRKTEQNPIQLYGTPIWEALFFASVSFKNMQSESAIRTFGMPTVGDATIDAQMHNEQIRTYMTINQMAEYFRTGVTVSIIDPSDCKRIYDIITAYLLAWKERLDRGINIGDAPTEDLILLDRLAAVVHPHAAAYFDYGFESKTVAHFSGGPMLSRDVLLNKGNETTQEIEPVKHQSLADIFAERVIKGGGRWKS
jgi:hypothetical protein